MNFVKRAFAGKAISNTVKDVAKSPDHQATAVGAIGAGLIAANIDYGKLLQGDSTEIGKAVGATVLAVVGYFFNRGKT